MTTTPYTAENAAELARNAINALLAVDVRGHSILDRLQFSTAGREISKMATDALDALTQRTAVRSTEDAVSHFKQLIAESSPEELQAVRTIFAEVLGLEQRAAPVSGIWLPIDTAPKDGTKILALEAGEPIVTAWTNDYFGHQGGKGGGSGWFSYRYHDNYGDHPVHDDPECWMPIPITPDTELPGMWERSDFEGGRDEVRGPDWKPTQPATGPDQSVYEAIAANYFGDTKQEAGYLIQVFRPDGVTPNGKPQYHHTKESAEEQSKYLSEDGYKHSVAAIFTHPPEATALAQQVKDKVIDTVHSVWRNHDAPAFFISRLEQAIAAIPIPEPRPDALEELERDAKRYRYLRETDDFPHVVEGCGGDRVLVGQVKGEILDATVDEAINQQNGKD
jgi:hypothetical protein